MLVTNMLRAYVRSLKLTIAGVTLSRVSFNERFNRRYRPGFNFEIRNFENLRIKLAYTLCHFLFLKTVLSFRVNLRGLKLRTEGW